ncbi:unnamed protein product [Peronospora farinosa]|nr:unnamed protein product [Peronospora farinosa]
MRSTVLRFDRFFTRADPAMQKRVQKALDVMRSAIDIFGLEGVCFSFNGGKDSTVVLHLLRIVVAKRVLEEVQLAHWKIQQKAEGGTTVTSPRNSFVSVDLLDEQELEARVKHNCNTCRLPILTQKLKIKGVYMGVRGGDPHGKFGALFRLALEYCSLYDHGYTSLGNIFDTVQNPELWRKGEMGKEGYYLPAYKLKDGSSERCGRLKKAHTTSKSD